MLTLRCSSLPVIDACPAAAQAPSVRLDTAGLAAETGTAVHEYAAAYAAGLRPNVEEIAQRRGVPVRDLGFLASAFREMWNEVKESFPNVVTERPLAYERDAEMLLTGTADAMAYADDSRQLRIADWKSGRLDTDHDAQLKGYALLGFELYPEAETVWIGTFRLRERVIDGCTFTRQQVAAWWVEFKANLATESYSPGEHCGRCWRSHECPAKGQLMKQAVEAMGVADRFMAGLPLGITERAKVLIPAVQQARLLKAAVEQFIELARADVEFHGGLSDGQHRLEIKEESRREILATEAWPVLREYVSDAEIIAASEIGKGRIEGAIKDNAQRGQKGKLVKEVFERLDEVGALETKTVRKLVITQVKELENVPGASATPAATPAVGYEAAAS